MNEELRECPHCGATRGLYTLDEYGGLCSDDDLIAQIFCDNCKSAFENERANNGKELIEAWNTRAEHTCRDLGGDEGTNYELYDFGCSECGYCCDIPQPNYCPHCGAKVVDE